MIGRMREKYAGFFLKQSMRNILYVLLVLMALAIAGFMGFFISRRYSAQISGVIEGDSQELAEQINISMSQYIHNMIRLSDSLYYNVIKKGGEMENTFQLMYDTYKDSVESIALFRKDGTLIQVAPALSLSSHADIREEEWYEEAFGNSENIHFSQPGVQSYFESDADFPWVVSMSRFVQITEGKEVSEGVLLINIKYGAFAEIFRNSTQTGDRYSFLMDGKGNLIYHPSHAMINEGFLEEPPEEIASRKDGSYKMVLNQEQTLCSVKTVGYTGWKIVSVMNQENEEIDGQKSQLFVVFMILLVLFGSMLFSSYLSTVLTRPIKNLESDVKRISDGELDLTVHTSGSFEVYHLGRSIQKMAIKIKGLMQAMLREQEEKRKSELDSLQAQITPHFLYNTLDIIVWMIEEERKQDAVCVVTALARLFRISLSKGKHIIRVGDELEHVRNYLIIQNFRFKDRFTYEFEIQDDVRNLSVIKLVVQPLVENAIYHGMDGMYGDGLITISAYIREGDLYISVRDNGMGMKQEQLEALFDYSKEVQTAKGNGLGVRNVHERIRLYFGEAYGLTITSELDVGTEVLLHLPAVEYTER